MVIVKVKVFVVDFTDIVMMRATTKIPSDWLFTAAFSELEAAAHRAPMGSVAICRRGEGGHDFYIPGSRAVDDLTFDRSLYEECRVLLTFPNEPVFAMYYALFIAVKQRHWRSVPMLDGPEDASAFLKMHGRGLEAALGAQRGFGTYWRRELATVLHGIPKRSK